MHCRDSNMECIVSGFRAQSLSANQNLGRFCHCVEPFTPKQLVRKLFRRDGSRFCNYLEPFGS